MGMDDLLDDQSGRGNQGGRGDHEEDFGERHCRRASSATRKDPAIPPKCPIPSIQETPEARPRVG